MITFDKNALDFILNAITENKKDIEKLKNILSISNTICKSDLIS